MNAYLLFDQLVIKALKMPFYHSNEKFRMIKSHFKERNGLDKGRKYCR